MNVWLNKRNNEWIQRINEYKDAWMIGWKNEWIKEWMIGWKNKRINKNNNQSIKERKKERMNE